MDDGANQEELLTSTGRDEGMLLEVLERIDENLAFRRVIGPAGNSTHPLSDSIPDLPSLAAVEEIRHRLCMSAAPLRKSAVGGLRGLVLRALNAPVRLFGSEAVAFNRDLRRYLAEVTDHLERSREQAAATVLALGMLEDQLYDLLQASEAKKTLPVGKSGRAGRDRAVRRRSGKSPKPALRRKRPSRRV